MKITEIISESKQSKELTKPRNFVAKNAVNTGAGHHKDKKRAEKQGDVKHKKQAVPIDEQRYEFQRIKFRGTDHDIGEERYVFAIGDNPMVFNFSSDEDNPDPDSPSFEEILAKVQRDGAVEHFRITPVEQRLMAKKIAGERRKYLNQRRNDGQPGISEAEKKGLYYNVNKRKKVGTSRDASSPKAPTAQAWKDAAKTAKTEDMSESERRMSRAAKGYEKYGKKGMTALAKAGREGASEEKLDKIRDKHDKYDESATAGATSAGNVGVGAVYKNKSAKQAKNKDGTAKNALDINANLLTGGSIKR